MTKHIQLADLPVGHNFLMDNVIYTWVKPGDDGVQKYKRYGANGLPVVVPQDSTVSDLGVSPEYQRLNGGLKSAMFEYMKTHKASVKQQ